MMRRLSHASALVLAVALASAVGAAPADGPIRLPSGPVVPQPSPVPPADGVVKLTGDALYVIDSKVDAVVRPHPAGLVKVTREAGPLRIRGKFVDGTGAVETRTYPGPFVFILEPAGKGRAEVDVVPIGLKGESDIVAATIDVDAGQGPIPPPKPPEPKPVDPPTPAVTSFRVIWVHESGATLTAAQSGVIYSTALATYLDSKCTKDGTTPGWRRWDKDTLAANDFPALKSLWAAVKPALTAIPCVVVEVNGKADILPLPATEAEALATFKRYAEGGK